MEHGSSPFGDLRADASYGRRITASSLPREGRNAPPPAPEGTWQRGFVAGSGGEIYAKIDSRRMLP